MIGEAVQAALKDAAYAVDWVRDGQAAPAALRTQAYDFVLLDLGLPGHDGLDVLRDIRAGGNPVPVLIITARDGLDDRLETAAQVLRRGDRAPQRGQKVLVAGRRREHLR